MDQTKPKRPPGRPAKAPEKKMLHVTLTMRPDQREKLDQLGGSAWVRKKIDKATRK